MVTEELCQLIVRRMYGAECTVTTTLSPDGDSASTFHVAHTNAVSREDLYDEMLLTFDIADIDAAISWLKVRKFIVAFGFGLAAPEMGYELTEKGAHYGASAQMPGEDRKRLSSSVVKVEPEIYGISLDAREIWWRIRRIWNRGRQKA